MTPNPVWKSVFSNWPAGIQHRGVLVTTLNETIPFKGFMIKEDMLLLDRTNPDPMGARFILIDFAAINCLKLIDPVKDSVFVAAGFVGKLGNQ
jgi:hypothetical protein